MVKNSKQVCRALVVAIDTWVKEEKINASAKCILQFFFFQRNGDLETGAFFMGFSLVDS